jgi:hypothetical protein
MAPYRAWHIWPAWDRALPKVRIEAFGGGRGAIIDDFRSVTTAVRGKLPTMKTSGKGHLEEVQAFANALRTGGEAPISWDELYRVSLAAILAVRSLREGVPFDVPGPASWPPRYSAPPPRRERAPA